MLLAPRIVLLKEPDEENHYRVMYDGDGPYSIGSTIAKDKEEVLAALRSCNPHATVEIEK